MSTTGDVAAGGEASPAGAGAATAPADFPGRAPLLRAAFEFARAAHAGQRLETDGAPYIHHPLAVGAMLHEAGFRDEVAAAGVLHDTLESSETEIEDLERRFGGEVATLVAGVSESAKAGSYEERKAAHREQVVAAGREAAAIFAADKLASTRNLRGAIAARGEASVDAGLKQGLERKLAHYEASLHALERLAPDLPFLVRLRAELDRLALQRRVGARRAREG